VQTDIEKVVNIREASWYVLFDDENSKKDLGRNREIEPEMKRK
jgi:hypothetical protein